MKLFLFNRGVSMGKIKSYTSSSGMKTVHYDENGNKIGETWQSASGGKATHYDANGNKTGVSYRSPAGHVTHYDSSGNKTGHSYINSAGQIKHYDTDYNKTGDTWGSGFGHTTQTDSKLSAPSSPRVSLHDSQAADGMVGLGCLGIIVFVLAVIYLIAQ